MNTPNCIAPTSCRACAVAPRTAGWRCQASDGPKPILPGGRRRRYSMEHFADQAKLGAGPRKGAMTNAVGSERTERAERSRVAIRKERTRAAILSAAESLFSRQGYDETTMQEIASLA